MSLEANAAVLNETFALHRFVRSLTSYVALTRLVRVVDISTANDPLPTALHSLAKLYLRSVDYPRKLKEISKQDKETPFSKINHL